MLFFSLGLVVSESVFIQSMHQPWGKSLPELMMHKITHASIYHQISMSWVTHWTSLVISIKFSGWKRFWYILWYLMKLGRKCIGLSESIALFIYGLPVSLSADCWQYMGPCMDPSVCGRIPSIIEFDYLVCSGTSFTSEGQMHIFV